MSACRVRRRIISTIFVPRPSHCVWSKPNHFFLIAHTYTGNNHTTQRPVRTLFHVQFAAVRGILFRSFKTGANVSTLFTLKCTWKREKGTSHHLHHHISNKPGRLSHINELREWDNPESIENLSETGSIIPYTFCDIRIIGFTLGRV